MPRSLYRSDTTSPAKSSNITDSAGPRIAATLPDEVLSLIASALPSDVDERRRNLSRLCLVCKRFYVYFNRELYRCVSIVARDSTKSDSFTHRLLTHLAARPGFRPFIEEIAFDFSSCDGYQLQCVCAALRELTSVRSLELQADYIEIDRQWFDVNLAAGRSLRRLVLHSSSRGDFNAWYVQSARLLPRGELRLLGGGSPDGHLSPNCPNKLRALEVDICISSACFSRLTFGSAETLTRLSLLISHIDFDLSRFDNLRKVVILFRSTAIAGDNIFFLAVTTILASAANLVNLQSLALASSTTVGDPWPKWISEEPSKPFHTCLPPSLVSLDIADACFDYDDLIPLADRRALPLLRRIILSEDTLGSMASPFDQCEPEQIKEAVEGYAADRGVFVEWVAVPETP